MGSIFGGIMPTDIAMYWPITTKAGDALTNPTTETQFASKMMMPPNYLQVGDRLGCDFYGTYMVPALAIGPTATAKILLGTSVLTSSGALTVGIGSGIIYSFWGQLRGVVRSTGSTGTILTRAWMFFQTSSIPSPASAGLGNTQTVTIDTTTAQNLALSVTTSNMPGQVFTLVDVFYTRVPSLATNT